MGPRPEKSAKRTRRGGGRRNARSAAVQALYQWQLTGQDPSEIEGQFLEERLDEGGHAVDLDFFHDLVHGVVDAARALDARLEPFLDRPVGRLDPVEHVVLQLGAFELLERPEIPRGVVINEAVDLAKTFGGENGHRYVNGVLDRLAREVRPPGREAAHAG